LADLIRIEKLSYRYPNAALPALRDVSLRVRAGEFLLLAGPSGAGKSTLMRCVNGLTPHFSGGAVTGQVEVAGHNVLATGPRQLSRLVGFVFQNPESQSVLERVEPEIAFGLEQAGLSPQEMRLRVEEALGLLELVELRDRPLDSLSGGERQRVAIAAALALRPRILVLDEPTSQLDPQSAEEVLQALVRLNDDLGLTVLLAEQRLERVLRYGDRLVFLDEGRVVVDGPVREAIAVSPQKPPLVQLGARLGWQPLPLTVKEGRFFAEAEVTRTDVAHHSPEGAPWPQPRSALLEADSLRFSYGRSAVLRGVSLRLYPGETVALLGRNGSGKSTLLRLLVGLLRPASGEIRLHGRSIAGRSVADICREVAYLPQNPDDLLFAESVAQEMDVTLLNHGLAEKGLPLSPHALLAQLGLGSVARAYPRDLSTGQRQRVALGAVMVTAPSLLLLDEPTRGLDYRAKQELVTLWRKWQAAGMGLLLVTHDVELAARVADRVIVLSQGEVIAEGPARTVLPASPFFAPQVARLFPGREWLTVDDALNGLGYRRSDE
jgi:energy-coupling factor transport system ATP-binding protein